MSRQLAIGFVALIAVSPAIAADRTFPSGVSDAFEKLIDMGDGTYARRAVPSAPIASGVTLNALEAGHVFAGTAFNGGAVFTPTAGLTLFLLDGNAVPGTGAITGCPITGRTAGCFLRQWPVVANQTLSVSEIPPLLLSFGAVLVLSTTNQFTITPSAQGIFSGDVK